MTPIPLFLAVFASLVLAAGPAQSADPVRISFDCARPAGKVRPLHGVNSGPLNAGGTLDLSAGHRQIAPPFTRLHDCRWPNPDVADIHAVFPDPNADPARPDSYEFRRTDRYIQAIRDVGSQVVYRLGESIEHDPVKRYVHPPKDPAKWAQICLGIIRHYNDGWANGFRHGIPYWEIWNEPENRPVMWTGTDEDFFRLYSTAAKAIKAAHPHLKVGGPGIGDTGRLEGDRLTPSAFLARFLEHCRRDAAPLDFLSWHVYTNDPDAVARRARAMRRLLDEAGFPKAESHLNEWNYLPGNDWAGMLTQDARQRHAWHEEIGGPAGAAFAAAVLMKLQDAPVDVANFYAADNGGFGLFNVYGVPRKNFSALKAFKALADTSRRLSIQHTDAPGLEACAGLNAAGDEATLLVALAPGKDCALSLATAGLPWKGPTRYEALQLDRDRDLTPSSSGTCGGQGTIPLPARGPCVLQVKLRPGKP